MVLPRWCGFICIITWVEILIKWICLFHIYPCSLGPHPPQWKSIWFKPAPLFQRILFILLAFSKGNPFISTVSCKLEKWQVHSFQLSVVTHSEILEIGLRWLVGRPSIFKMWFHHLTSLSATPNCRLSFLAALASCSLPRRLTLNQQLLETLPNSNSLQLSAIGHSSLSCWLTSVMYLQSSCS